MPPSFSPTGVKLVPFNHAEWPEVTTELLIRLVDAFESRFGAGHLAAVEGGKMQVIVRWKCHAALDRFSEDFEHVLHEIGDLDVGEHSVGVV